MPKQKPSLHAIQKDLQTVWKLLNQLATTLSRVTAEISAHSEINSAGTVKNNQSKSFTVNTSKARARGRQTIRSKKGNALPDTTSDFFAKHISRRKRTAPQIFESVLQSIGAELSADQKKVLRNRLVVWLSNSVKSENSRIDSIGTGKERRYFLP